MSLLGSSTTCRIIFFELLVEIVFSYTIVVEEAEDEFDEECEELLGP